MNILHRALAPLLQIPAALAMEVHPKLRGSPLQRLGLVPVMGEGAPRIWLHGASAGDVAALSPLVTALRQREPGAAIALSAMTASGVARARRTGGVLSFALPLDSPGAMARAVTRVRPWVVALECTEIWPSLIHQAHRFGARVAVVNARLRESSLNRYRPWGWIFGEAIALLSLVLAVSAQEATMWEKLGVAPGRIRIVGDTKADGLRPPPAEEVRELAHRLGVDRATTVVVLGSTHRGEEALLLPTLVPLLRSRPQARLMVAPRYPHRAAEVLALARSLGLEAHLLSEARHGQVTVVDTMGDLPALYGLAQVAFVGGTLVPRGGQNLLEPAMAGAMVLFGPMTGRMEPWAQALEEAGRGRRVGADRVGENVEQALGAPRRPFSLPPALLGASARVAEALVELAWR